jgi:hypothetical protein
VRAWRIAFVVAAVVLYGVSISGPLYQLTSPVSLHHHILLRKCYALGAFSLLGYLFERARFRLRGVVAAAVAITAFSYLIELGQIFIDHAFETFAEHGFDVASGLWGGAFGAFVAQLRSHPRMANARRAAVAIAVVLAALIWFYLKTYNLRDV